MKTLLISGGDLPLPQTLRDVIVRGSTSVEERRAADLDPSGSLSNADRVVFWAPSADAAVCSLAARYALAEKAERKEVVVFVTTVPDESVPELPPDEVFVWPQDEDRLTMAFLTGA